MRTKCSRTPSSVHDVFAGSVWCGVGARSSRDEEELGVTDVDAQTGDWEADRAAFGAEPAGDGWDRCGVDADGPLARRFGALAAVLLEAGSLHEAMERVVSAALRIVPGADLVSITMRSADGGFHTPVRTGEAAEELDRIQYRTG